MIRFVVSLVFVWPAMLAVYGSDKENKPFALPRPEEVVAFTNGYPPGTGFRVFKRKEEIMRFLKDGKAKWDAPEYFGYENEGRFISACDGVFLDDKGRFFFWSLNSRKVLLLQMSDGRRVLLDRRK